MPDHARRLRPLIATFFALAISAVAAAPPNLVVIFADDLGYGDLGCYGGHPDATPQLDALAAQGTRFTDFYAQTVCGPSRAALLTGRYPSRAGNWDTPAEEIMIPEVLAKAGYRSACFGKWDSSGRKPALDRMPVGQGFDHFWGSLGANDNGYVNLWENETSLGRDEDIASLSRRLTDRALDWIRQHRADHPDRPFFVFIPHNIPHTVIDASPEFRNRTGRGLYADTLLEFDHECGRLVREIDAMGLGENTLILFTSDNGPWSNDVAAQTAKQEGRPEPDGKHPNKRPIPWTDGPKLAWGSSGKLRGAKMSDYEGGVRVPCLVRWTGKVPAGKTSDAIFSTLDFLPTFAALAGTSAPADRVIDGFDQTALLFGESDEGARDHYFYFSGKNGVRRGEWKLLYANRWPKNPSPRYAFDRGTRDVELYNLETDPGETTNLADQHPEVVAELQALKLPEGT